MPKVRKNKKRLLEKIKQLPNWPLRRPEITIQQFLEQLHASVMSGEYHFQLMAHTRYKFIRYRPDPTHGVKPVYEPVKVLEILSLRENEAADGPVEAVRRELFTDDPISNVWVNSNAIGLNRYRAAMIVLAAMDDPEGYSPELRRALIRACNVEGS